MKLTRSLLYAGGAANAAFFLFHLLLGWKIHRWTQIQPELRALMEMFNVSGALLFGFFCYVSFRLNAALTASPLGRSVLGLVVLVYATRAAGEFVFAPVAHPWIVAACLALAAFYLAALLAPSAPAGAPAPNSLSP